MGNHKEVNSSKWNPKPGQNIESPDGHFTEEKIEKLIDQICQNGSSHPIISCELKSSSYSLSSNTGHNEESDHANGSDETSQKSSAGKLAELSSLSSSSAATDNEPYQNAGTHPSGQNHNKTAIIKEAFKQIKDKPLG